MSLCRFLVVDLTSVSTLQATYIHSYGYCPGLLCIALYCNIERLDIFARMRGFFFSVVVVVVLVFRDRVSLCRVLFVNYLKVNIFFFRQLYFDLLPVSCISTANALA